jgi:glyoxylase-like metal-dependent hydrolase (beta-lactamase superfamily II)
LEIDKNRPEVTPFFDHATNTWTYLVSDPDTGEAVIIDAVLDDGPKRARVSHNSLEKLCSVVERRQLKLRWILESHDHADHLAGGHWLRGKSGAQLVIGARIAEVQKGFAPRFGMDNQPAGEHRGRRSTTSGRDDDGTMIVALVRKQPANLASSNPFSAASQA